MPNPDLIQFSGEKIRCMAGIGAEAPLVSTGPERADSSRATTGNAVDVNPHAAAIGCRGGNVVPNTGYNHIRGGDGLQSAVIQVMLESSGGIDAQLMGPGAFGAAVVRPNNQAARADVAYHDPR